MINLTVKGTDKLIKKLSSISKEARNDVDQVTISNANGLAEKAKNNANNAGVFDDGDLVRTIFVARPINSKNEIQYSVVANAPYAPYQEFGTGAFVSVPSELRELALRFKGKGIRKVNIYARPFMYPAYRQQMPIYFEDLKALLKEYVND